MTPGCVQYQLRQENGYILYQAVVVSHLEYFSAIPVALFQKRLWEWGSAAVRRKAQRACFQ